jgi:hypothetical protein
MPAEPELLRRDVHPADVLLPGETLLRDVRVFVTSRRLLVYGTTPEGGIERRATLALKEPCSVPASRATLGNGRLEVHLADGGTAWVNRGQGCGCGSPLKALAAPVPWSA